MLAQTFMFPLSDFWAKKSSITRNGYVKANNAKNGSILKMMGPFVLLSPAILGGLK